jgi:hypothetical protein
MSSFTAPFSWRNQPSEPKIGYFYDYYPIAGNKSRRRVLVEGKPQVLGQDKPILVKVRDCGSLKHLHVALEHLDPSSGGTSILHNLPGETNVDNADEDCA